ncbi:HTH domain-containing protein [Vagococcus coleopterorum]|uniref:HTH domain-containing protein n=2 Tax=Vagococcus coleopterorum TaxID=2714946 RepID=A0A6G8AMQ5_9ENTE|nr:HTH domain-containing protein [Vagococcus coleopterorum]
MRDLLDTTTKRRLAILEELNLRAGWISSNELAEHNNASLRTISNDINYLKEQGAKYFQIEISKKNGVRLNTFVNSQIAHVYSLVMRQSETFNFIEKILFNANTPIEEWAEKLFISDSSIYRIANQMKDSFSEYEIELNQRPCYLKSTHENYVRHFYTHYFAETYGVHNWPYDLDKKIIVQLSEEVYKMSGLYSDEFLLSQCSHLIAIGIIRYQQGFYYSADPQKKLPSDIMKRLYDNERFMELIYSLQLDNIDHFLNDFINNIYFLKANWLEPEKHQTIGNEINEYLNLLEIGLGVPIDEASRKHTVDALTILNYKYLDYPKSDFVLFDRYSFNIKALESSFPFFCKVVAKNLHNWENRTGFPWSTTFNNKVTYWTIITWQSLPTLLENKRPKASLLIFNDLGHAHAELLVEMINKNFMNKVETTIYPASTMFLEEADIEFVSQFDYFIANFYNDIFPKNKTIVIEPIPSDQDWAKLRHAIHRIYRGSKDSN